LAWRFHASSVIPKELAIREATLIVGPPAIRPDATRSTGARRDARPTRTLHPSLTPSRTRCYIPAEQPGGGS
jgi:hypothetical protein